MGHDDIQIIIIDTYLRLRRLELKNGCHMRSFIFVIQSKFKLMQIDFKKIKVPTGCILSVGAVPTENLSPMLKLLKT